MDPAFLRAIALGIIEGLTEYLPVSSTGHLLLAEHFLGLGFGDPVFDKTFAVLIQLGSILALALVYFQRLFRVLLDAPKSAEARNFILGILIAFLPAALLGVILRYADCRRDHSSDCRSFAAAAAPPERHDVSITHGTEDRHSAMRRPDPGRLPLRCDHRWCHVARRR